MKKKCLLALILLFLVTIVSPNYSMAQDEVKIGYLGFVLALPTFARSLGHIIATGVHGGIAGCRWRSSVNPVFGDLVGTVDNCIGGVSEAGLDGIGAQAGGDNQRGVGQRKLT